MQLDQDTIAAVATAQGYGGIGVIRLSGPQAKSIAVAIAGFEPKPRQAHYCSFLAETTEVLDQGLLLFFPNPHSFTGEDVLELQGHGGPVILDMLLQRCLELGARQARPGEFSERAFLNGKLDLAQAEAIADLIEASSKQAARNAVQSLQGAFSRQVHLLVEQLIQLRMYVEGAIDFPEEEIDFLNDGQILGRLEHLEQDLDQLLQQAGQGALLRDGMTIAIAGRPNAGKSSLLNALARRDVAIVTEIAGTTRDVLHERIQIEGMPLHILDTAGLRVTQDRVEQIGIQRAVSAIQEADRILLVVDSSKEADADLHELWREFFDQDPDPKRITLIRNKVDLSGEPEGLELNEAGYTILRMAARDSVGIDTLCQHLKACMGYQPGLEMGFSARRRHLEALRRAATLLQQGREHLLYTEAGELLAEDLRLTQQILGEITGSFSSDELLGRIFSSFCIGK
ncbi:tRNA modification GTPase [Azomonas agilis]|uniref:tRNA modification GTPase MnmE n=1 Tax=Azomonas agilis TaxID=116849 RepID=A0A562HZZ2_9GAMM|nr:tRNA uridine-5-carboxymethylaminomethyl(34) synthesis GTPase MnmE [Azomonas agilis]TWH64262.1 tRNA modification GTPase [Azomonas agilis]